MLPMLLLIKTGQESAFQSECTVFKSLQINLPAPALTSRTITWHHFLTVISVFVYSFIVILFCLWLSVVDYADF